MICFPDMLANCAKEAGMKVPADPDEFEKEEYPHFFVFLAMQLGASLPYAAAHWDNAKIIAEIPEERLRELNGKQIVDEYGFAIGRSGGAW